MQTREQHGINIIGSRGDPMGKRAAVQGRPFALVRVYAANTHQLSSLLKGGKPYGRG